MKMTVKTLTMAVVIGALQTLSAAEITGKVKLTGTAPAEKDIPLDANCGKVQPKKITTRHYVVGADSGLANVFVWIKEGVTKKGDAPADGPLLDQAGCEYQPYVLGVQVGQKFKVRNSDPLMHNVNATAVVNKGFNFAQVTKGQVNEKTFDKQEVLVRFKCDVHPWMFAYVGVVDHGFFSVTDKDGNFKIAGLPAGKYTVEAYHLKAGKSTQEITVTDSDKKEANFTLSVPAAQ